MLAFLEFQCAVSPLTSSSLSDGVSSIFTYHMQANDSQFRSSAWISEPQTSHPATYSQPYGVTDRISNVTQLKEPLILLILLSPQVFPTSINVATSHPEAKAKNLSVAIYSSSQVSLSAPHAPQQSSVGPVHSASRGHTWSSSSLALATIPPQSARAPALPVPSSCQRD